MDYSQGKLKTRQVIAPHAIKRNWHLVDAGGQILGRTAVTVARHLQGRNKTTWSPMQDTGDHVVVINCADLRVTGQKLTQKTYYHHTRYPGHLRSTTLQKLLNDKPTEVMRKAVYGMLPRTRLRKPMIQRLHLFAGGTHPFDKHFSS